MLPAMYFCKRGVMVCLPSACFCRVMEEKGVLRLFGAQVCLEPLLAPQRCYGCGAE